MQLPPVDRSQGWPPQGGADPNSTGTSGAVPVRPASSATPAAVGPDRGAQEKGLVKSPETPSTPDESNKDWTAVRKKDTVDAPPEPPKEPISKQLLEFVQSMWRASGSAVELAQQLNSKSFTQDWQDERKSNPLTYEDPSKVKKTSGL
jgi:hypothetical protein